MYARRYTSGIRRHVRPAVWVLAACLWSSAAAPAAASVVAKGSGIASPFGLACVEKEDDGVRYRRCEGDVRSFDGLPLSTTVTLPADARLPLPLIVMRHGSHLDKRMWERQPATPPKTRARDWDNVAFASRGYAVLTSTARGWHDSCGPANRQAPADFARECEGRAYWVHFADPRWEVRDVQTQIGRLVDEGWVDPEAVGVYGMSMGGVEAWHLALLNDRTMAPDGTLSRWRSPAGTPLRIAAAVPEAAYADMLYGVAPNGRMRDDVVPTLEQLASPFGVPVEGWAAFFCAGFAGTAELAPPGADPTADFATYCRRLLQGEPFRNDPVLDPELAGLIEALQFRAPLRTAPVGQRVPIFLWQGLSDGITTGIHGVVMLNRLRELSPGYPVKAWFDDIAHAPGTGLASTYDRIHEAGHAFFAYHLKGEGEEPVYDVTAAAPACASRDGSQTTLRARRWHEISGDVLSFSSDMPQVTASADGAPFTWTGGPLPQGCIWSPPAQNTTRAAWTFRADAPVVLAGAPEVKLTYTATGVDPQINVRLWDVRPDGSREMLISRTTFRPAEGVANEAMTSTFQLWPQVWPLAAGHALRLEVSGQELGAQQSSNTPFVLDVRRVELRVPVAGADSTG